MPTHPADPAAPSLAAACALARALPLLRRRATVLVLDMVGSTRLMCRDEAGTIGRWLGFVDHLERVLAACGGRLVKSLGDGALIVFDGPCADAATAVAAATALRLQRELREPPGAGGDGVLPLELRMGLHVGELFHARHDVYGQAVNLAARIAGLAAGGEVLASAAVREALQRAGHGGGAEDLGERWVKHVDEPLRVYRLGPVRTAARPVPAAALTSAAAAFP